MSDTVTEEIETAEDVVEEVLENVEDQEQQEEEVPEQQEKKEEFVPVSAQIAERRKRQDAEERVRWLEQQMMQNQQPAQQPEPDNSDDLLTVGQQQAALGDWKRSILEEAYMDQNPDVIERIRDELPEVLSDPRHKWLADSIVQAPNRLQRAAQVLEMMKPKRQAAPPPNRANTPKSPQSVAKTNKLSLADRIMTMSDQELENWRVSQKQKIR